MNHGLATELMWSIVIQNYFWTSQFKLALVKAIFCILTLNLQNIISLLWILSPVIDSFSFSSKSIKDNFEPESKPEMKLKTDD